MKAVKKFSGGGIADDRGTIRRELDRQKKAKRIKDLEGKISAAKGTPAAKSLVQEYRQLTGTK
jgi:hypothetical protein